MDSQTFYSIDVETANWDPGSICSIGIATFKDQKLTDSYHQLINPQDDFDQLNITLHGITPADIVDKPTWKHVFPIIEKKLGSSLVIHHGHFDRTAIKRANSYNDFEDWETPQFLNSTRVVRRTWSQFSQRGYGLENISQYLGISFKHHNALEDAVMAATVVIEASKIKECQVHDWINLVNKSISSNRKSRQELKFETNEDGHLYGEEIVFTGSLSITRSEAARIASEMGCNVGSGVTKKTTLLVVGIQDKRQLGQYSKSSKLRKAELYIQKGGGYKDHFGARIYRVN